MQLWAKVLIIAIILALVDRLFIANPGVEKLKTSLYQTNLDLKIGNVLTPEGKLQFTGYLSFPTLKWNPSTIKTWRFKQWDFYALYLDNLTLCIALADFYYAKNAFLTVYRPGHEPVTYDHLIPPWHEVRYSNSSLDGISFYNSSNIFLLFTNNHDNYKQVLVTQGDIDINLEFRKTSDQEGMVYLGPFNADMSQFFYSHKQYNYLVSGYVKLGKDQFVLDKELGMMDWGRGVWPYHGGWLWASGLGMVDGTPVGLNIGELPKDRNVAGASDDCIIIGKTMIKLGIVNFDRDENNKNVWNFYTVNEKPESRYGAIKGKFYVEKEFFKVQNFWVIGSKLLQLFGRFEGVVTTLDSRFEFKIRGIVEDHECRW